VKLDASDIGELRPLITETVLAVLDQIQRGEASLPSDRIGFLEPEAAALLGVRPHVLRDGRQRGLIQARRLGKSYVYSRQSLVEFVNSTENGTKKKRQ
jgi:hypothetical protein